MKEGGFTPYEPIKLQKAEEIADDIGAEIVPPQYRNSDSIVVNCTDAGSYVVEATLKVNGAGTPVEINLSNERGVFYKAYSCDQDRARGFLREIPRVSENKDKDLSWEDFAGFDELVEDFKSATYYRVRNPDPFEYAGSKNQGVLLHGPPGTGKSYLTDILASESDAELFEIKVPDILTRYVGESETAIRDLFNEAMEASPSILRLEEVDALGGERGESSARTFDNVVNTLLTSVEDALEEEVQIVGTTNRKDQIDDALLRPGRLGRHIEVSEPDLDSRMAIIDYYTAKKNNISELENNDKVPVDLNGEYGEVVDQAAEQAAGLTSAQIENVLREAATQNLQELREEIGHIELINIRDSDHRDRIAIDEEDIREQIDRI